MDSEHIVLSRLLPKTGQTQCYVDEDDGYLEKGWWKGRDADTNRERFVVKTISGDDVVIDRATGLMWGRDGSKEGCVSGGDYSWGAQLLNAKELTFAGFSDWRMPNIFELISIVAFKRFNPAIDPLFVNTYTDLYYWSSTTYSNATTSAWYVAFLHGGIYNITKNNEYYVRCVRSL